MPASVPWNMDPTDNRGVNEEASRDPGVQSTSHHDYNEKDFEGHRVQNTVYVGFHIPNQKRHSHHRRHRHHRRSGTSTDENNRPLTPPAQRVQFILGEEIDDDLHESHPLFSEMEELVIEDGEIEWRETARFIKFEEEVEEGGNRWSKPHVATLSLHSLFELRSCIMHGAVMLDMEAQTLEQITDLLVENWVNTGHLSFQNKDRVRDALLRRHRHQHERKANSSTNVSKLPIIRSLAEIGRNYSSSKSSNQLQIPTTAATVPDLTHSSSAVTMDENGQSDYHMKSNLNFMKKIPAGAETSNILLGELDFLDKMISGFVRLTQATMLGDLTEVPVPTRFIFVLLGPVGGGSRYHEIGRGMATLMSDEVFHDVAYKGKNRNHLLAGVDEFLDAVTVLPPGEWDPNIRIEPPSILPSQDGRKHPEKPPVTAIDEEQEEQKRRCEMGLERTGFLFGGLINDIKRKAPWFLSDFKDAIALQCVASWIFLYFACLTPIITFGGLLGEATESRMAAIESLVSGFVCGLIYGLFSGQPLTILGSTGPVLVFETILYDFCSTNDLDYLSFRWFIGMWIGVILIILVAIDASYLVVYITRFTEENFATLIALIFIFKAIAKLLHIGHDYPLAEHPSDFLPYDCVCQPHNTTTMTPSVPWIELNRTECAMYDGILVGSDCGSHDHQPDVFIMSVILFCGTFFISVILKNFRTSSFFPAQVRQLISDFAVIISILSMSLLDWWVGVLTPKLIVPEKFSPTWPQRTWFIHPFNNNPWWTAVAAPIPALLGTILIFMDQQITAVIVNRKENNLKKGCGYHLDLFVLAILIMFCSCMGLPWFVAATVLSINHVNSLKLESKSAAPGEKPKFLGVREQRVTHVMIFVFVGLSVVLTPVLKCIPMPVLFGVFLYMGMSSLKGLQFFDRILIMFMPVKYQPDFMFLRQVELKRVHLFTLIQLACLIVLWLIKSFKSTSILFPLMLVVMIGVRKCLDFVFTERELKILDDVMPEFKRRKDMEEKMMEEDTEDVETGNNSLTVGPSGNFQIMLPNGNVMKIPGQINISEEMNKSGVWKQVNNSVDMGTKKSGSDKKSSSDKKGKKRSSSKDSGTEEERKRLSIIQDDDEDEGITIRIDSAEKSAASEETNV